MKNGKIAILNFEKKNFLKFQKFMKKRQKWSKTQKMVGF